MDGIEKKRLDQIGEVVSGATPSTTKPDYWDGEVVWITPNDLSKLGTPYLHTSGKLITEKGLNSCSAQLLPPGSITISSRAPIGYVAIPTVEFCTNQGCKSIELRSEFDSEYTYYNICFHVDALKNVGEGTTFSEISKSALAKVEMPFITDRLQQTQIATILSTIDKAIEQTEAIIAKQQRVKTGLMQDLLTRGIDEHGNLRSEETHEFKDSPLGRIPVEWDVNSLDRILILKQYGISTSLSEQPDGVPVLRMSNLVAGEVDYSELKYSDETAALKLLLNDGDVLFNRTNSIDYVGRTGIYRHQGANISFASYLVRLIPNPKAVSPEYLNLWLNDATNQIRVKQFATIGVQQANVNPTNLGTLSAAYPKSVDEQNKIIEAISAHDKNSYCTKAELEKLQRQKTALMQDLLTGKVRVTPLLEAEAR